MKRTKEQVNQEKIVLIQAIRQIKRELDAPAYLRQSMDTLDRYSTLVDCLVKLVGEECGAERRGA